MARPSAEDIFARREAKCAELLRRHGRLHRSIMIEVYDEIVEYAIMTRTGVVIHSWMRHDQYHRLDLYSTVNAPVQ